MCVCDAFHIPISPAFNCPAGSGRSPRHKIRGLELRHGARRVTWRSSRPRILGTNPKGQRRRHQICGMVISKNDYLHVPNTVTSLRPTSAIDLYQPSQTNSHHTEKLKTFVRTDFLWKHRLFCSRASRAPRGWCDDMSRTNVQAELVH